MIGQKIFEWIDRRCMQATSLTSCLFGNLSVSLVGEIAQSAPNADSLYYPKPVVDVSLQGFYAYQVFYVIILKVNYRANGESEENC